MRTKKEKFIKQIFMIELERTFLAKYLPEDLMSSESKEVIDIYIPQDANHPCLRLRKNGGTYEMTKKSPIKKEDATIQKEQTIILSQSEFETLSKVEGKKIHKVRYNFKYNDHVAEFDMFQDDLEGLVLVDFEFESEEEKNNFEIPDFCLVDISQEKFIAGGMLCGKKYTQIEDRLEKFGYAKL